MKALHVYSASYTSPDASILIIKGVPTAGEGTI